MTEIQRFQTGQRCNSAGEFDAVCDVELIGHRSQVALALRDFSDGLSQYCSIDSYCLTIFQCPEAMSERQGQVAHRDLCQKIKKYSNSSVLSGFEEEVHSIDSRQDIVPSIGQIVQFGWDTPTQLILIEIQVCKVDQIAQFGRNSTT